MAIAVGLLLETELELLLELVLVLREFVTTVPSHVCSVNLTFFLAGSGPESPSQVLASDGAVSTIRSCEICAL